MTSPVSAIEAIEKAPNRIQGMVRSIDQYRNGQPKAVADGSYAQVLYALTDYKHDVLVLWDFAVSTARQAEALQRENAELREALRPFGAFAEKAERFVQGRADFGGEPVMPTKHFRLADFRRARALLGGSENAE